MTRSSDPRPFLPLSEPVFHILLSLVDAPRHGYGILLEVEARTGNQVRLGTSTLYTALKRLLGDGLVEEAPTPSGQDDPRRQRYYRLTAMGRSVVRAEVARLEALVRQARTKDVLTEATS